MTPAVRWARHRSDLVQAAAEEISAGGSNALTVERVTRRAGRGRNTFYAHFRDVDQVLRAVESSVLSRVAAAVEVGARVGQTEVAERLAALARAWIDVADANPSAFRAMLLVGAPQGRVTSRAREVLSRELRRVLDDATDVGATSVPLDELRLAAVAGLWDGALRVYVERRMTSELVVDALVDATLRTFQ